MDQDLKRKAPEASQEKAAAEPPCNKVMRLQKCNEKAQFPPKRFHTVLDAMEQLDIHAANDVDMALSVTPEQHNDGKDKKTNSTRSPCVNLQFLDDAETDQKDDIENANDREQLKKDLLLKADEFFNSGCAKIELSGSPNQHVMVSSPPSGEVFLGLDSEHLSAYDSNLLKYCVAMGIDDDGQVPLEHMDDLKDELNALECRSSKQLDDDKPSYSSLESLDMDSAENIEKVLNLPAFDPQEPQVRFIIKRALSLNTISRSKDNVIQMFMPVKHIKDFRDSETFNPMTEHLNTFAKHDSDEFCTFCSCKECIAYREIAIHIMMEQFKASHMIVLLLDALIKAYSPLLRNATAFNCFEKLLENNKDIYWIASGLIYNKKYEHLDLIYDETLTDPMTLVLFSSILMVNNPMQLLQILSFHVKCIIKAFAVGISEVSSEEKLSYIIGGFDHLCLISEQIASYFFMFEKYFLNRFSLSWVCLCQRLFHQHVYMKFFVAITNSGENLKSDDPMKNRYFDFSKRIIFTDMRWNRYIWPKLQQFNLTDIEMKRRKCMLHVHQLFDAVVEDALRLPLEESNDDNLFFDIHSLENRRLAWQNIMAFAKMKWSDGFFNAPNTLVLDLRCEKCGAINEQHESKCECVTCSIGGDPLLTPLKMKNICLDCLLKQRKMNEESQQSTDSTALNETDDEELKDLLCTFIGGKRSKDRTRHLSTNRTRMWLMDRFFDGDLNELGPEDPYHISWATFKHLTQRERYVHGTIDEKYFCKNCNIPACMLARKLLNNEISPELTSHLITHFHALPLLPLELRALLPNIVFYNQRLFTTSNDSSYHNFVVKSYWTFIVSLYTTYFFDFEPPSPLNLSAFVIEQSDIKLMPEKLTGNKDDTKFLEFLAAIRSFAPPDGGGDPALFLEYLQMDDIKQQLDSFLKTQEERRRKILSLIKVATSSEGATSNLPQNLDTTALNGAAVTVQPTASNSMPEASTIPLSDNQQKKNSNTKPKKCCLEHAADLGAEHCKESHAGKKRLKKDCSHARINETRDRLRKKLQNARKHQQQQQVQQQQLPHSQTKLKQQSTDQCQNQNERPNRSCTPQTTTKTLEEAANVLMTSRAAYDPHQRQCHTDVDKTDSDGSETLLPTTPPPSEEVTPDSEKVEMPEIPDKVIGKVIEICDMIDNNKLKMKKWIDETLTYIEGYASTSSPNAANPNKKAQPQTKNPKKAAKKAKQKLRKEEEKRIGELHEIRAQFQDIYFKEFVEKIELKSLKSSSVSGVSKRRCDKKRISEIEANIKKLQRAKAKLEGNILELIATVKQTNTEFKFPYLPTKEQQQAKLLEIEQGKLTGKTEDSGFIKQSSSRSLSPPQNGVQSYNAEDNAFNYAALSSTKFFPNIGFPYGMDCPQGRMQSPVTFGYNNGLSLSQKVGSSLCYAPPQQLLSTNAMALAANESNKNSANSSPCSDPSKRIVTIRRVHNPNLPDSQVTVTARGSSPNEDKLLYTFINGQLVPTMPNVPMEQSNFNNNSSDYSKSTEQKPATVTSVSKSKLKKERRRQAKLNLEREPALCDSEATEIKECEKMQDARSKQKRGSISAQGKLPEKNGQTPAVQQSSQVRQRTIKREIVESENRAISKESNPVEETEAGTKANSTRKTKKADKKAEHSPVGSKKQQQLKKPVQLTEETHVNVAKTVQSKAEKKSVKAEMQSFSTSVDSASNSNKDKISKEMRRHKLVNHGQFDNNPYKTLHMQDSDSELDVTASSCDEDSASDILEFNDNVQFEEVPKPKSKVKQQKPTIPSTKNECNSVVQKRAIQQNTISNENKSNVRSSAGITNEQRKTKPTSKKPSENHISNGKVSSQAATIDNRTKQKENENRKNVSRECKPMVGHANDRRQAYKENVFSSKAAAPKTYQNTTQRGKKSQTQSPTAPALSKRNNVTTSSNSIASKTSLHECKSASKRAQRTKKKQEQQQKRGTHTHFADCGAGIPDHMEHFNPNEVKITHHYAPQQAHFDGLSRQFQGLQLSRDTTSNNVMPSYASVSANKSTFGGSNISTVSIMDQLNRGVQVENLSLPPGITLTKVDPIKSEQLRIKSESIKRLSQPLQQTSSNNMPIIAGGYQHHGSTIVAPPTNYLPAQYLHNTPNAGFSGAVPLDQGNIIMVENTSTKTIRSNSEAVTKQSTSNVKVPSKSKRRRNKGKRAEENVSKDLKTNSSVTNENEQLPKMITLRNPMFHNGPVAAAILQQPGLLGNRHGFGGESGGVAFPPQMPMDQPAAIIKNENGMFTIRNPALHQAVTNGLALSGYRQFGGNVSYYTPQEAVAEAARAAQQHQVLMHKARMQATVGPTESFSYFSNNPTNNVPTNVAGPTTVSAATSPTKPSKTISITCSVVGDNNSNNSIERNSQVDEMTASSIARPSSAQKCISAIGSEVKNNRNSTNVDHLWSEYGQQENLSRSHENLSSTAASIVVNNILDENKSSKAAGVLQDKYQQSSYYNGFEVFSSQRGSGNHISTAHSTPAPTPALGCSSQTTKAAAALTRSSNSLFDATVSEAHMHHHTHHSCGDDSPPPTSLLGYSSSYLDDIPNTGVIRYDDASFLKNLIPGQRLNKEVSIHNINESSHGRASSPMSHLVEITPVYSGNNKVSQQQDLQSKIQQRFPPTTATYSTPYQKNFNEFVEPNVFPNSGKNYLNLNQSDTSESNISNNMKCEQQYKMFNYDFETPTSSSSANITRQKSITDLNSMFVGNYTATSHRTSPFLDDTTMDNFVQNLNALQIGNPTNPTQSVSSNQQLNGESGRDSAVLGNTSNSNSTNSTPASGWW